MAYISIVALVRKACMAAGGVGLADFLTAALDTLHGEAFSLQPEYW